MRPAANDLFQEEPISQADLRAAQRRNSLWEALQASSETHAHITIETDTLPPLEFPVAATLVNPSIVPDAVLEFGTTQLGLQLCQKSLAIHNPSDQTMYL